MKLRVVSEEEFLRRAEVVDWRMFTLRDGQFHDVLLSTVKGYFKKHILYDRFGTWIMQIDESRFIEGDVE